MLGRRPGYFIDADSSPASLGVSAYGEEDEEFLTPAFYRYNDRNQMIEARNGGAVVSYYCDAFGNPVDDPGGSFGNPFSYAGYVYDDIVKLYNLNALFYDAKIARFMQEDTYLGNKADPLSLNLYTYCMNEPLGYWDPSGHAAATTGPTAGWTIVKVTTPSGAVIEGRVNPADNRTYINTGSGWTSRPAEGSKVDFGDGRVYNVVSEAGAPGGVGGQLKTNSKTGEEGEKTTPNAARLSVIMMICMIASIFKLTCISGQTKYPCKWQ